MIITFEKLMISKISLEPPILYIHISVNMCFTMIKIYLRTVFSMMTFFLNPSFIIDIDPILDNLKSVSNDEKNSMDDKIYSANDLLEEKGMTRPTLESKTEYIATINQIFEQDNSYVFQITYDDGKDKVLTSIDLITLLFKKTIY